MTHPSRPFPTDVDARRLRPLFGVAAAAAAALTLGLTVVAPAEVAPAEDMVLAHVKSKRIVLAPTEVAILPRSIEVVASRSRAAGAGGPTSSPYLPAAYQLSR